MSYIWVFGDGGYDAGSKPYHIYANASNTDLIAYSVELLIRDKNGCEYREVVNSMIYVRRKPDVDFTTDQNVFCITSAAPDDRISQIMYSKNE